VQKLSEFNKFISQSDNVFKDLVVLIRLFYLFWLCFSDELKNKR